MHGATVKIKTGEMKFLRHLHYKENGHSVKLHVPGALTKDTTSGTPFQMRLGGVHSRCGPCAEKPLG
jgi:hypothetical protein